MTANPLGAGVTRYADNRDKQFAGVIFQANKPPLDSELNLISLIELESRAETVRSQLASGWLMTESNPKTDYFTNSNNSNLLFFGRNTGGEVRNIQWANVNGWMIPVTGTRTGAPPLAANNTDSWNRIELNPPSSSTGGNQAEFAFLEVWIAHIDVDPASPGIASGKPARGFVYRFGNVEGGFSFLPDDLVDPNVNFETTKRIQVQYRIRVVQNVNLAQYPEGFDPTSVFGQGILTTPSAVAFTNMRDTLGDPGLWRAGTGDPSTFGTIDGYVYAIPLCSVFRRNSSGFSDVGNLAGAFNRNSLAQFRTDATVFTQSISLPVSLSTSDTSFTLTSITGTYLETINSFGEAYFRVDDEIIKIASVTAVSPTSFTVAINRGQLQTTVRAHNAGVICIPYTLRPDGLFADQITSTDILDMRHSVADKFDYDSILKTNLVELLKGNLRTAWKRYGSTNSSGPVVLYGDRITDSSSSVGGLTRLDAPDGNRRMFSDAVTVQKFTVPVTVPSNSTTIGAQQQVAVAPYNIEVDWTAAPTIHTAGNRMNGGAYPSWWNGDKLTVRLANFIAGLPAGDADQVRFILPSEDPDAVLVRFEGMTTDPNGGIPTAGNTAPTATHPKLLTPSSGFVNNILKNGQGITVTEAAGDLVITLSSGTTDTLFQEFVYAMQASTNPTYAARLVMHIEFAVVYGAGRGLSHKPDYIHTIQYLGSPTNSSKVILRDGYTDKSRMIPTYLSDSPYVQTGNNRTLARTSEVMIDPGSKSVYVAPYKSVSVPALLCRDGSRLNWHNVRVANIIDATNATPIVITTDDPHTFTTGDVVDISVVTGNTAANGTWFITVTSGTQFSLNTSVGSGSYTGGGLAVDAPSQGAMPTLDQDGISTVNPNVDPLQLWMESSQTRYCEVPVEYLPKPGLHHIPLQAVSNTVFPSGLNFLLMSQEGPNAQSSLYNQDFVAYPVSSPGFYIATSRTGEVYGTSTGSFTIFGRRYTNPLLQGKNGGAFTGIQFPPFCAPARVTGVYARAAGTGAGSYTPVSSPFDNNRVFQGGGGTDVNLLRDNFDGPTVLLSVDVNGDLTFILNSDAIDLTKATPGSTWANTDFLVECTLFAYDRGFLQTNGRLIVTKLSGGGGSLPIDTFTSDVGGNETDGFVGLISPAPLAANSTNNELTIYYNHAPYQGDVFGSQNAYSDDFYRLGPLTIAEASNVVGSPLGPVASLTLPNKTGFEILAAVSFETSLGTGRLSGSVPIPLLNTTEAPGNPPDYVGTLLDLSRRFSLNRVGFEDWASPKFPVTASSLAVRPTTTLGALDQIYDNDVHQEFSGCTTQLPLGALFRDKDFIGKTLYQSRSSNGIGAIPIGAMAIVPYEVSASQVSSGNSTWEGVEFVCGQSSSTAGAGSESMIRVDGTNNVSSVTVFKTSRGGAAYSATGPWPGGVLSSRMPKARPNTEVGSVLLATAYLVRSQPEVIGSSEIHMGSELQMVIVTQAAPAYFRDSEIVHSASGANEGFTAADRYRIMGRPLEKRRGFVDMTVIPNIPPLFVNNIYDNPLFFGSSDIPTIGQKQVPITISSDGQTVFTLPVRPLDPIAVQVYLNGIKLEYGVNYTVNGTTNQTLTYIGSVSNPSLVTTDTLETAFLTY